MSVISAVFIGKIVEAAATEGLDPRPLLTSCGVDPDAPVEPSQMVSSELHYSLWETILAALDSPGFPIRYAATVRVDDYGAFGLATKTAPTVREGLQRGQRYHIVMTNSSWLDLSELESHGRIAFQREGDRRLGMRCANEAALAEIVGHARQTSAVEVIPRCVRFRHPPPSDVSEHERFFGCELLFDQPTDAVDYDPAILDLPLAKADPGISKFMIDHLDKEVAERAPGESIDRALRVLIRDALPDGPPSMDDVAKRVGMSRRTLARRMSELETTFQRFVDDTRHQVAATYLLETQHSLAEIAFLLGFSEQSAFQRAFKRWTGTTPREFRVQQG